MFHYIIRRILQMIPTVLGVILITFVLFNVVGGSPASMTLGRHVSPQALEEFDEQRGFNKPLFLGWWARTRAVEDSDSVPIRLNPGEVPVPLAFALQTGTTYRLSVEYRMGEGGSAVFLPSIGRFELEFSKHWKKTDLLFQTLEESATGLVFRVAGAPLELRSVQLRRRMPSWFDSQLVFYLRQIARFDFGMSSSLNQPVSRLMVKGMGPSLVLMTPIFIAELLVSVAIALVCAFFRNTRLDRMIVVVAVALMSINYLVWIVVGQYLLGFKMGWFPVWGFASWHYLLLPVLVGLISGLGGNVRFYRTIMLDEMYKDYVRTAFAKGVSKTGVLFKHVLKNAMIPIVTNVIIAIPFLYTGALLLESFFGIPGLGYLGVNAVNSSDVDVIRAEVFIGSVLFVVFNLITDLCYAWLDPRVKLE
jgi:peptide/nickel transport system permease protein